MQSWYICVDGGEFSEVQVKNAVKCVYKRHAALRAHMRLGHGDWSFLNTVATFASNVPAFLTELRSSLFSAVERKSPQWLHTCEKVVIDFALG